MKASSPSTLWDAQQWDKASNFVDLPNRAAYGPLLDERDRPGGNRSPRLCFRRLWWRREQMSDAITFGTSSVFEVSAPECKSMPEVH